jgi:hypothetical protein
MNLQNECVFGKDESRMTGRGWQSATICSNKNIEFRHGNNVCPYATQVKCKFFRNIKEPEVKPETFDVSTMEELDNLTEQIREKMKSGKVKVILQCNS